MSIGIAFTWLGIAGDEGGYTAPVDLYEDDGLTILYEDDGATALTED